MDCRLPGSSVHGISQARILEWGAISFSRGSSQPRDWTCAPCIGRQILYQLSYKGSPKMSHRPIQCKAEKEGSAKECSNYHTFALISHALKVMSKILQAQLQQYVNQELLEVQARFRKCRGTRDQIANIHWIIEKQGNCNATSASLTMLKPLSRSQQTVENS